MNVNVGQYDRFVVIITIKITGIALCMVFVLATKFTVFVRILRAEFQLKFTTIVVERCEAVFQCLSHKFQPDQYCCYLVSVYTFLVCDKMRKYTLYMGKTFRTLFRSCSPRPFYVWPIFLSLPPCQRIR